MQTLHINAAFRYHFPNIYIGLPLQWTSIRYIGLPSSLKSIHDRSFLDCFSAGDCPFPGIAPFFPTYSFFFANRRLAGRTAPADGHDIAFTFEVLTEGGKQHLYVQNGSEKLLVDNLRQQGDSLWIQMPFFASRFALVINKDGSLAGNYIKDYGNRLMIVPFTAKHGNAVRYTASAKPRYNLAGKWEVKFEGDNEVLTKAVGEFSQQRDGTITGTFLTPTGDYRYLAGTVSNDTAKLSAFDGGHAVLFTAVLRNDSTISEAALYSGLTGTERWTAFRNDNAKLPDSYTITKMRPGETTLSFRFPSTEGKMISINDEQYKGKVVIVQILGSWCPNCMDETAFLSRYYKENKDKGVEIIGLAYERLEDYQTAKEALQPFRKRFDVQYPFLVTGVSLTDEKRTEKTLPQLDNLQAFPTTIFIGKNGKVDEIHTGYDGPATGEHHEAFKREFDTEVRKLLME